MHDLVSNSFTEYLIVAALGPGIAGHKEVWMVRRESASSFRPMDQAPIPKLSWIGTTESIDVWDGLLRWYVSSTSLAMGDLDRHLEPPFNSVCTCNPGAKSNVSVSCLSRGR